MSATAVEPAGTADAAAGGSGADESTNPALDPAAAATGAQGASHDDTGTDWKAEARKWEDRSKSNLAAKSDIEAKLNAVLAALGAGDDTEDPAKAAEQYKAAAALADQKLAVYQATPAGVDANALLDSQAFLNSLNGVQDLAGHIAAFVEANPRFQPAPANAGARDAAQRGQQPAPQFDINNWIRSGGK